MSTDLLIAILLLSASALMFFGMGWILRGAIEESKSRSRLRMWRRTAGSPFSIAGKPGVLLNVKNN